MLGEISRIVTGIDAVGNPGNGFVGRTGGTTVLARRWCTVPWLCGIPDLNSIHHRAVRIAQHDVDVVVHARTAGHVTQNQAVARTGVGKATDTDVARDPKGTFRANMPGTGRCVPQLNLPASQIEAGTDNEELNPLVYAGDNGAVTRGSVEIGRRPIRLRLGHHLVDDNHRLGVGRCRCEGLGLKRSGEQERADDDNEGEDEAAVLIGVYVVQRALLSPANSKRRPAALSR